MHGGLHDWILERSAQLARAFEQVRVTRMAGVPLLNTALSVEAIGFAPHDDDEDGVCRSGALGILLTPWFMNLVWLPADRAPVAASQVRAFHGDRLSFMAADEAGIGPYQICSLFSPVFEFADQDAARATAGEVLRLLRQQPEAQERPQAPSRRAFLTGRLSGGGAC